jgi:Na+-transporting NADH:ubiquinone oxidoreductase subunit NqrF
MKTKTVDLTKAHIRSSAIKELTRRGCTVWVQNNLAVPGRKFIGKRGQSDIIGFRNKDAVIVAVEVKTVGDRLSDDQIKFLNEVKKAGGLAYIACQSPTGQVEIKEWEIQKL